jgi:hypothetical protein
MIIFPEKKDYWIIFSALMKSGSNRKLAKTGSVKSSVVRHSQETLSKVGSLGVK